MYSGHCRRALRELLPGAVLVAGLLVSGCDEMPPPATSDPDADMSEMDAAPTENDAALEPVDASSPLRTDATSLDAAPLDAARRPDGGSDSGTSQDAWELPGASDGGSDTGPRPDGGSVLDGPCDTVPTTGRCLSATQVEYCGVATGASEPGVYVLTCGADEVCDDRGESAYCRLTTACREGEIRCADATTAEVCSTGAWVGAACPRACVSTALGDGCAADVATTPRVVRVAYETRGPNSSLTDWDATYVDAPAQGFLVVSFRGTEVIDAQRTSDGSDLGGYATVQVPIAPAPDDQVAVFAAGVGADGSLAYVIADPGLTPSDTPYNVDVVPPAPRVWGWGWLTSAVFEGALLRIDAPSGAGAARLFDWTRYVYSSGVEFYAPSINPSVVLWLSLGADWSCGACMWNVPTRSMGLNFRQQGFISADGDESYWSDAVTVHELGHYFMSAYGQAPLEGGTHFLGTPTHPGQAWSEGWATFFSSDLRDSPYYFDKQRGGFFWFALDARRYSGATAWTRPVPSAGLFQRIDENEVASMLWGLSRDFGRSPMWTALAAPRVRLGPFERGYHVRTWPDPSRPELYSDTPYPAPMVADYFDALGCAGLATPAQIDRVTEPGSHYPYPSASPLCR
jgi:hypothetical protein